MSESSNLTSDFVMKLEHLSASRINTYLQCPLKYHAIYDLEMKGDPHPAALMGKAVHKMFEMSSMARHMNRHQSLHDPFGLIEPACKKYGVRAEDHKAIREMTHNAIQWGYFRKIEKSLGFEVGFLCSLPDGTKVKGFIDRLDPNEVIDLKTNSRVFSDEDLETNWQARVYNWAARKINPGLVGNVMVAFWVLRHRVQRVVKTLEDAKKDEISMMELAGKIRESKSPTGFQSGLCPYCPYSKECRLYSGKVSEKEKFLELRKRWD